MILCRRLLLGLLPVALLSAFLPRAAVACSVCFGDPDAPETHAASLAIVFLLGVTALVLGGMGTFFIAFMRRARRTNEERS